KSVWLRSYDARTGGLVSEAVISADILDTVYASHPSWLVIHKDQVFLALSSNHANADADEGIYRASLDAHTGALGGATKVADLANPRGLTAYVRHLYYWRSNSFYVQRLDPTDEWPSENGVALPASLLTPGLGQAPNLDGKWLYSPGGSLNVVRVDWAGSAPYL